MKKSVLAIALFMVSVSAVHAAAIKWAIGGTIDPTSNIDTSVGSFVLAYIGKTGGTGVDAETFTEGLGSTYSIVQEKDWSDFYNAKRSTYATAASYNAADENGATYQAFFTKDGKYFLVNDPTIVTMAISIDPVTSAASTGAYVNGTSTGASTMYAAGGSTTSITSVPEPSTAALALAGLALLLKRRKA